MLEGNVYEEVNDMSFFHQDPYDDEDEALSLCDLPIYGDHNDQSADSSSSSSSSTSSSFCSSNDDDCFEFSFSSSDTQPEKNAIIFCGKIIPSRNEEEAPTLSPFLIKGRRKSRSSTPPPNHTSKVTSAPLMEKRCHATPNYTNKTSSSSKWYNYLLMFGLVRIQGHMELKDIKKRQIKRSRRHRGSTTFCREIEEGHHQIVNKSAAAGEDHEMIKGKGLLSFLRPFSCISPNDDDVDYCRKVKASLWCVQQLRHPHY